MNNDDDTEKRLVPDSVTVDQPTTANNGTDQQPDATDNTDNNPDNHTISGYALKFNQPSKDLGGFVEVIDPHALDDVDLSNVIMLSDHDYSKPVASVKAGTLQLNIDDQGLAFTAQLDTSVSYANDLYQNVQNGNVDSMSFRFDVDDGGDQFQQDDNGQTVRTIEKLKDLFEVSAVTVPAYDSTNIKVDKRSYEDYLNKQSEAKAKMDKTIIKPVKKTNNDEVEVRNYERYIRSAGETRDLTGLQTSAAGVVIPKAVVTPILELKEANYDLGQFITRKPIGEASGTYPVALTSSATLATKAELTTIGDISDDLFKGVDYKLQTRAGKIYLSQELIDDSAVDIVKEVKDQMGKLVQNTDNANIVTVLTTAGNFQTKAATSIDDLKSAKNTMLDPALDLTIITNQDGFDYLDRLKDNDFRYLLQPDVQAASGKALFGVPVAVVSNAILPDPAAKQFPIFIGDLGECVFEAYKAEITSQWQEFDSYSQGLSVVMRSDYQPINKNSGVLVTLSPTVITPTATPSK